ncbi:MAG: hypothetical protein BGO14_08905 [Chlamydiales bacterium 38-26]|nr:MAG: hypothetical protein BGO14_08905 [Chlamydiales bacterium 38-26]
MIKKVDLIAPHSSQYGALYHFTEKMYEAWLRAGYQARYFKNAEQGLHVMEKDPPDLIIGFNGIPRDKQRGFFCDILQKCYLTLLVDPYYRFFDVLSSSNVFIGCDDFSSLTALKSINYSKVLFVPHAVERDLEACFDQEKVYDVSLMATFIDFEKRKEEWKKNYPKKIYEAMSRAVEITFNEPSISFIEATMGQLQLEYQKDSSLKSLEIDLFAILKDIEIYVKGKERVDILKAIHSTPVHVFGHTTDDLSWKQFFKDQANIIIHAPITYEESLKVMQQSKIILNSSIKNKYGAHERVFSGLAAGALVITNENAFLSQYFSHGLDIVFYRYKELDQLDSLVKDYLMDDNARLQMVENGRDLVMTYHTWDERIKMLERDLFPLIQT